MATARPLVEPPSSSLTYAATAAPSPRPIPIVYIAAEKRVTVQSTPTSAGPTATHTLPPTWEALWRAQWQTGPRERFGSGLEPRKAGSQRAMDQGAIAGSVIGAFLAVGLLAFCLWPFIARHIKRRRDARGHTANAETGVRPSSLEAGQAAEWDGCRGLSTDSFKGNDPQDRGGALVGLTEEPGPEPPDGSNVVPRQGVSLQQATSGADGSELRDGWAGCGIAVQGDQHAMREQSFPPTGLLPPFYGEFYPQSPSDNHAGILQGTSADYYSPEIPSEAFGMFTEPQDDVPAERLPSRGSSLRFMIKQMLPQKDSRRRTLSSHADVEATYDNATSGLSSLRGPVVLHSVLPNEEPSVPAIDTSQTQASWQHRCSRLSSTNRASPTANATSALRIVDGFSPSPPIPSSPAPGTINPMQIMPASTLSERYHQIEQELYSQALRFPLSLPSEQPLPIQYAPIITSPSPSLGPPSQEEAKASRSDQSSQKSPTAAELVEKEDVAMTDAPFHALLSPRPAPDSVRRPSRYVSEGSAQLPGPASTVPSTHSTSSTQLGTSSPESMGSSDFRTSTSPQTGLDVPSLGDAGFHCDEPRCNQVFDQPHKLKYVSLVRMCFSPC